ncbi:hypothetical protein EDWATA_01270 [Edwardsiella tarda ATCC 23685]|uniref:Uncharacterized protein n=1 Tax=Edwardsiella tarda ATCC 23685 TaxID=500638 RepID=D4F3G0_EDWTA|nr:hypothetical protein EDWATA_01270 [Edwardsiella tarda ATCC 23685]
MPSSIAAEARHEQNCEIIFSLIIVHTYCRDRNYRQNAVDNHYH